MSVVQDSPHIVLLHLDIFCLNLNFCLHLLLVWPVLESFVKIPELLQSALYSF